MAQHFSRMSCFLYIAALSCLLGLSTLYKDTLFEASHERIKSLQEGRDLDSSYVKFMETFSELTDDFDYMMVILALSPFLSRERFWYILIANQITNFVKINLKMTISEPRPTWAWSDLSSLGCSSSFGSPSGHSARSSNLAFIVILDLFFASEWSQRKYPHLNKMTPKTHKLVFVLVSFCAIGFWFLNLFDRVFLGKHTLNQVFLGSQIGIWSACFAHFVLRDSIYSHFNKLTNKVGNFTKE